MLADENFDATSWLRKLWVVFISNLTFIHSYYWDMTASRQPKQPFPKIRSWCPAAVPRHRAASIPTLPLIAPPRTAPRCWHCRGLTARLPSPWSRRLKSHAGEYEVLYDGVKPGLFFTMVIRKTSAKARKRGPQPAIPVFRLVDSGTVM